MTKDSRFAWDSILSAWKFWSRTNRLIMNNQNGLIYGQPSDEAIIIDIGTSLSNPSGFKRIDCTNIPTKPFAVPEPPSGIPFDRELQERHQERAQWIETHLLLIQKHIREDRQQSKLTSEASHSDLTIIKEPHILLYQENLQSYFRFVDRNIYKHIYIENDQNNYDQSIIDVYGIVHTNSAQDWKPVNIILDVSFEFLIPPRSSFLQASFLDSLSQFHSFSNSSQPPGFDCILLDPPWPNRSVRRANHKNSYKTSTFDIYDLEKLNIQNVLRQDGVLGIWITNSSKWRKYVLNRLFKIWKLEKKAEWIWVKITPSGDTIFDLGNITRKPYESLILARRKDDAIITDRENLADKIIFAIPDIHSRKPCLKRVLEPYLQIEEPRICEIFARNLTEGWFSWGNEVLKGNWRGCWTLEMV